MRKSWRTIFALLTRQQRLRVAWLVGLLAAMTMADIGGVVMVLPFLAIVANPGVIEDRAILNAVYEGLGFETPFAFLWAVGLLVFAVTMLSIALRALTFHQVTVFARGVALSLSVALLRRYLSRPYVWFLRQHSADLGKAILDEVHDVTIGAIAPSMRAVANATVLIGLLCFLLFLEPLGTIVMAVVLGGGFAAVYARLDAVLSESGRDRRVAIREKHQIIAEVMSGIKEVKVMGLEDAYLHRFVGPSRRVARHQATVTLLAQMPRYALEALTFGGILMFVLWLLYSRDGRLEEALPVIGAFAFSGLKFMPLMQTLFQDVAQFRHNQPALEGLHGDLDGSDLELPDQRDWAEALARRDAGEALGLKREIALDDVSYHYPGADDWTLRNLDLTIPAGRSTGIVGMSGAGKTTVLDLILGLLAPDEGTLRIDGRTVAGPAVRDWQRGIGYVPQAIYLVDDTIAGNIAFGEAPDRIDRAAVERAARLARLDTFVDTLSEGYDTWVGERGMRLSGGQRQRIGIARALYRDPDLIVFDEATSALDSVTERAVIDAIQTLSGRMTIIMVTHRLSTVAHCDQIVVLEGGRVAGAGPHATLAETSEAYRTLLRSAADPVPPPSPGEAAPAPAERMDPAAS